MKTKTKHYWVFVTLLILGNVGVFLMMSKRLEKVVIQYTAPNASIESEN